MRFSAGQSSRKVITPPVTPYSSGRKQNLPQWQHWETSSLVKDAQNKNVTFFPFVVENSTLLLTTCLHFTHPLGIFANPKLCEGWMTIGEAATLLRVRPTNKSEQEMEVSIIVSAGPPPPDWLCLVVSCSQQNLSGPVRSHCLHSLLCLQGPGNYRRDWQFLYIQILLPCILEWNSLAFMFN